MSEEARDFHAGRVARYQQAAAYARDNSEEYDAMAERLREGVASYLDFAEAGGLTPSEALGDLLRHVAIMVIRDGDT